MLLTHLSADFQADRLTIGNQLEWRRHVAIKIFDVMDTAYQLIVRLKKKRYHIVQVNPSFKPYPLLRDSFYLWLINRLGYGSRTVVFFHGWDGDFAERIIHHPFYKRIFTGVYQSVGLIFVLYPRCKEQLVQMGIEPQKIKVTTTMYKRIDGLKKERGEKVNLFFLSVFLKGKGVWIAARVAKLLVENGYHHFRFTFAGDGPLLPRLKAFVAENHLSEYVETPGYVRDTEKEELLRKSDILLFPTQLPEGCPVVVIEAMGAGQAVVSTPKGAIPDLIKDGENGFICDSQDPAVFYEAVKKLLDNRELLHRMQEANRKKAEENYEVKDYTRRMEEVYLCPLIRQTMQISTSSIQRKFTK